MSMLALTRAAVLDCTGAPPIASATVLVENGKIAAITPGTEYAVPNAARVIDLTGMTILPGMINTHDHLTAPDPEDPLIDHAAEYKVRMTSSVQYRQTFALRYGPQELRDGVTTIRILGEKDGMDFAYKEAFDRDLVWGPRILPSGPAIATSAQYHGTAISTMADGEDGVRAAVRRNAFNGAKVIKLLVSGGRKAGVPRNMTISHFTPQEIRAAIDEAHTYNIKVTAHLNGGLGVKYVVDAGIDGIEHGMDMTDDELDAAARANVVIGMTLLWHCTDIYRRALGGDQTAVLDQYVRRIYQSGATIVAGNDHCHQNHGLARQVALLAEFGVPPMIALQAVTRNAALACGIAAERGTLAEGLDADIIAVPGNPVDDVGLMADVRMVMKAGRIYHGIGADQP